MLVSTLHDRVTRRSRRAARRFCRRAVASLFAFTLAGGCLGPLPQRRSENAPPERPVKKVVVTCAPTASESCKKLAERVARTLKQATQVDARAVPTVASRPPSACIIQCRETPDARKTLIAVRARRLEVAVEAAPLSPVPGSDLPLPARRNAGLQYAGAVLLEELFRIVQPGPGELVALSTPLTLPAGKWRCIRRQWPVIVEGVTDPAVRAWLSDLGAVVREGPAAYPWEKKALEREFAVLTLPPELGLPLMPRPRFVRTCRSLQRLRSPQGVLLRLHPFNVEFMTPSVYTVVRSAAERTGDPDLYLLQYSFLYGRAAWNVRQYFQFWEELWEKRGASHWTDLRHAGWGDPVRGVYRRIDELVRDADFTAAAQYLHDAQLRVRDAAVKRRLQLLMLTHDHARFIAQAVAARNRADASVDAMNASIEASRRLENFRKMFARELRAPLDRIRMHERLADDAAGVAWKDMFLDAVPLQPLADGWRFRADPDNVGEQEKWFAHVWPAYRQWPSVKVDRPWEPQRLPVRNGSDSAEYDGIAWYALRLDPDASWRGRKVYLNICAALHNTATVYVNGKRLNGNTEPGSVPPAGVFRVRIDPAFRGSTLHEVIVVRFNNRRGPGGFVRPPWLSLGRDASGGPPAGP